MAADIAQMNLRNRARIQRLREKKNYSTSKCLYKLKPFDPKFNPIVHNKYLAARDKKKDGLIEAEVEEELTAMLKKMKDNSALPKFTWTRFFVETFIIGMSLKSIPSYEVRISHFQKCNH